MDNERRITIRILFIRKPPRVTENAITPIVVRINEHAELLSKTALDINVQKPSLDAPRLRRTLLGVTTLVAQAVPRIVP